MGVLEDKRRARIFYRYLSHVYDRLNPFIWTTDMREASIDLLNVGPDDRVLDVGCGTGFGTLGLLDHASFVTGLDQSSAQLDRARTKIGPDSATFVRGDAERLPFADDAFDVVWSSGSIEYWPRPVDALAEFRRICRPGGDVLVVGPHEPSTRIMRAIADRIMLFYDRDEADRMFTEAGLPDVEHHLMGPSYNPEIAITSVARVPA